MKIALNTDYLASTGDPEKYLNFMAEAGFTHVHWCHQWNTDFLYSPSELSQYKKILKRNGLTLLDIHGSSGQEKCWCSTDEYCRKAGVDLVINRMEMLVELEGEGVLMMHAPYCGELASEDVKKRILPPQIEAQMRSLDELIPAMDRYNVKIALENLPADTFEILPQYLNEFPAEWIGVTFDSGHANMISRAGLELIRNVKDRIEALHLHDNDSSGDQHQPPFYGNIDWANIVKLIRESSYSTTGRPLSFELVMRNTPFYMNELEKNQPDEQIKAYLADAYDRCKKVVEMYESL